MSQSPNLYSSSKQNAYPPHPPQQPGLFGQYPPQPNGYPQYSPQPGVRQSPPYVDPNTVTGYEQNQISFQPPPVVPHAPFPKDEEQGDTWDNFTGLENKGIRRAFLRKVYFILLLQLLVTFGIVSVFRFTTVVGEYVKSPSGRWAYWTSYAVFIVTYLALACCKSAGRRFPLNLILLSLLTLSMAYMMGMISAYYTVESIFIAIGITCFVCLGITLFSFQTKFDFTSCYGILFAISLAVIGFGFVCIFTYSRILYTIYAGLGAVAFSIFLAVDTQLIMGGKRHEISAEDHIFASIMLYLDVVYIFMYILMLMGKPLSAKGFSTAFIGTTKGPAVTTGVYIDNCLSKLLLSIETYHSYDDYVFWPDLSTSHYANETTQWLLEHQINFVPEQTNPTKARLVEDFWSILAGKVYEGGWKAINELQLKRRICQKIKQIDIDVVQHMMNNIRTKLRKVEDKGPFSTL